MGMRRGNDNMEVLSSDILIVGGGAAGLAAAVKASEKGANVLVVDKGVIGWAGQVPVSGGRSMVIPPEDNLDTWVRWAVENGEYLSNQDWAYAFGGDTYKCTSELAEWGLPLRKPNRELNLIPRMKAYQAVQFIPGEFMLRFRKAASNKGAKFLNKVAVADLVSSDQQVSGAIGIGVTDGKFYLFKAKAVIIANGSCRYKRTKLFNMCNGEGVVMAYRAGAELINAEFSNSYGHCLKGWEVFSRDPVYYFYVNKKGERIVQKYFPEMAVALKTKRELQDFSKIVFAMGKEVMAGNGPIYMDLTTCTPEELEFARGKQVDTSFFAGKRLVDPWNLAKREGGVDVEAQKVEVIPMFVGGQGPVRVDLECRTSVSRLWAAGDASALGCGWSGAKSPGSYPSVGISFAIVSGYRAGLSSGDFIKGASEPSIDMAQVEEKRQKLYAPLSREKGADHRELFYDIHGAVVPMKYNFFRKEERLKEALGRLEVVQEKLKKARAKDSHQLVKLVEADGMAVSGEITYRAALMRTETRGTNIREDFPRRDDKNWLKWIVVREKDGVPQLSTEAVPLEKYKVKPLVA